MPFPQERPRRLRRSPMLRALVREHHLQATDLIYPLFVVPGHGVQKEIASLPGTYHLSVDRVVGYVEPLHALGLGAVLLFGIPEHKDEHGSAAWDAGAPVQQAVRALKQALPDLIVITDVCLCEYTTHGHCGPLGAGGVDNDAALPLLARTAQSHAEAGADIVAPSDMMDGRVAAIRAGLDEAGYAQTAILSYAVKYASAFYGPFRDAAGSTPAQGDRRGYQMDPGNAREALREAALDIDEGADALIVKPALPYLDVLARVRERALLPLVAYHVSGEYAMLVAAAERGWLDYRSATLESVTACKRAGADLVITYAAGDILTWLREEQ